MRQERGRIRGGVLPQCHPTSLARRFASREEVANLVVYLWSPAASGTQCTALRVKGGTLKNARFWTPAEARGESMAGQFAPYDRGLSTIDLSLPKAASRGRYFMPQSGPITRRLAGTCLSARRIRSATVSGVSTSRVERSSTPRMMVLFGNFSSTEQSSLDWAVSIETC